MTRRSLLPGWTARRTTPTGGRPPARRLSLEALEIRDCPAIVTWIAPSGSGLVSDTSNWDTGKLPGPTDDVVFPASVPGGTVTNDLVTPSVAAWNSITVLAKNYTFAGSRFLVDDGGITINYASGSTTFTAQLDYLNATATKITVANPGTTLTIGFIRRGANGSITFDGSGDTKVGKIAQWFDDVDPPNTTFASTTVIKDGTGTVTFQGTQPNSYGARTIVNNGTLVLNQTGANALAIPGELQIGDATGAAGTAVVISNQSNQIADTANVTLFGDGLWDLSTAAVSEKITGLRGTATSAEVRLGGSALTLTPSGPAVYTGAVTGTTGTITVTSGDQTFSGPITTTGAVRVSNGAILEIQNVAGGTVGTVNDGFADTFYNSSTSGSLTVGGTDKFFAALRDDDGNVLPASPTTGTLNLNPTSIANFLIAGLNNFSSVVVTTSVTSLGQLSPSFVGTYSPNAGEAFKIIDYLPAGAFPTTFAGLPEGSVITVGGVQFRITYQGGDGNDVVLANTAPQSVTLNQASFQADPTTGSTATFDAVFSGAIKPFSPTQPLDTSKILLTLGGTLTSSGLTVVERSPTTYRITVTGLTGTGTLTMNLAAGAGLSFANVGSLPSTSSDNSVTVVGATGGSGGGSGGQGTGGGGAGGSSAVSPGSGIATLVGAGAGSNLVNIYRGDGSQFTQLRVTGPEFSGGVRVASADFNGDGYEDYVFGSGPGGSSTVRVIDGRNGVTLFNTSPFEQSFTGGIFVAAGDLNGDGTPDLVATPDVGGGPRVIVFNGRGFAPIADFLGIDDPNFRGGARPAIGDVTGDGVGDLIIAAGFGGGPRIAGYNGKSVFGATASAPPTKIFQDFYAFESSLTNGAFVTVADVNGDGFGDVIAGGGPGGSPRVTAFSGLSLLGGAAIPVANFFAGDPNSRGGARLAVSDFNGDGTLDLVAGAGDNSGSKVTIYPISTLRAGEFPPILTAFDAFPDLNAGVYVG